MNLHGLKSVPSILTFSLWNKLLKVQPDISVLTFGAVPSNVGSAL